MYSNFIADLCGEKKTITSGATKAENPLNSLKLAESDVVVFFSHLEHVSVVSYNIACHKVPVLLVLRPFAVCVFIHRKYVPDW